MTRQRSPVRPPLTRSLGQFETLEARIALSADGLAWGNAPYLSLSFAPDGTGVDSRPSQLFSLMNDIAPEAQWKDAIVSAFQTWAVNTNADVSVTADSGDDFGIDGRTQGDDRFGDIRIAAIPMRPSVFAIGVSRGFVAGTWAGDVLFNTRRLTQINSVDDIFHIALHEAGHVFGFEESNDPNSVMHQFGIPSVSEPSSIELDELWARFGQRSPDVNEPNDVAPDDATHLYSNDGGDDDFDGTTPLIFHGDIGANDVDIYRFDSLDGYQGDVTFEVRTSGLSQLHPIVRVISEDTGQPVDADVDGADGTVSVTLPFGLGGLSGRHFVHVDNGPDSIHGVGGYALVTTFDRLLQTSPEAIDRFAGPEFRFLEGDDITDIFRGDPEGLIPFFGDDMHMNDVMATATPLEAVSGFDEGIKYELVGSISDNSDVDYYSFESADFGPNVNNNVMSFLLENVESPELQLGVTLFDETGTVVEHTSLVNHDGRQLVQITGLQDQAQFFVRIETSALSPTITGNYRLTIRGGVESEQLDHWQSGFLTGEPVNFFYRVHQPELTMFAYQGTGSSSSEPVTITLASVTGSQLTTMQAPADGFRSSDSILLQPGVYRVRVQPGAAASQIPFNILKATITDPLAVAFKQVASTPALHLDEFDDVFVFPNQNGGGNNTPSINSGLVPQTTSYLSRGELRRPTANQIGDELAEEELNDVLR